jgi:hypothetical protein
MRAALEGTVSRGPDAASQYCAAVEESWDSLRWEVEEVRDGGNWVPALGRIRGRGTDSGVEIALGVVRSLPRRTDSELPYVQRPKCGPRSRRPFGVGQRLSERGRTVASDHRP